MINEERVYDDNPRSTAHLDSRELYLCSDPAERKSKRGEIVKPGKNNLAIRSKANNLSCPSLHESSVHRRKKVKGTEREGGEGMREKATTSSTSVSSIRWKVEFRSGESLHIPAFFRCSLFLLSLSFSSLAHQINTSQLTALFLAFEPSSYARGQPSAVTKGPQKALTRPRMTSGLTFRQSSPGRRTFPRTGRRRRRSAGDR